MIGYVIYTNELAISSNDKWINNKDEQKKRKITNSRQK